jgi:hypothetical protein
MPGKPKSKLPTGGSKQPCAPCQCGCGAKSSSTIAAHRKKIEKRIKLNFLNSARSVAPSRLTPLPVPLKQPQHQTLRNPTPTNTKSIAHEIGPDDTIPDPMDADPPENHSRDRDSPPILARVWASRGGQYRHEDVDPIPEPSSPELPSDDEDEDKETEDANEPIFFTDDEICNDYEAPTHVEISARDQLTANFQLCCARAGMSQTVITLLVCPYLTPNPAQEQLDQKDLETICAFNYHILKSTTRDAFEGLRHAFPAQVNEIPSLFQTQRRIAELSGLKAEYSDCCPRICCCFEGPYENLDRCPFPDCQEPRYDQIGTPRMQFQHLPVGPRL